MFRTESAVARRNSILREALESRETNSGLKVNRIHILTTPNGLSSVDLGVAIMYYGQTNGPQNSKWLTSCISDASKQKVHISNTMHQHVVR